MLDSTDRRMLAVLQDDGRITNQDLSQKVGLSPTPCLRRLKRLEESGVIRGYSAIVDPRAYGLPFSVFVSIRLSQQTQDNIAEFEKAVESWNEVAECYLMTGSQDYLLRVLTDGIDGYERFLKQKITRLKCIQSVESNFAMATIKKRIGLPPI
ncbi:Lrp/AsnC family transcriptional regulator [Bosea sp. BK604]|uniref:Lrp/AsnC family transcriptional regulator n=1 Tax=Bosea sp. BK604 TaxID=2512180 RepID=UPI00104A5714|nr:Lrp/AsnC family transcriptional regulator [Bosea sp. BK604]TCR64940.1 AsnC family transcriptional regulator [Bosea sp. BK604]